MLALGVEHTVVEGHWIISDPEALSFSCFAICHCIMQSALLLTVTYLLCAFTDDVSAFAIHRFITELKQLHQGWVHNDITPRHLALYGADQLGLIDFECCRKQGTVPEPALYTGE